MIRKILFLLAIVFIAIQFIPVDLNNSTDITNTDFIVAEKPPTDIALVLKNSCYDCHSNTTRYPWYDRIAPVSWWVAEHIEHGKKDLNFSEWTTFSDKKKKHKLEEIVEMVEEEKMPIKSYLIMHGDTKLTTEQVVELKNWIATIK
ncbi:heme-binding domain-containing protein [Urechidicola croceus]|uniref:Cytochrome C n=1 Tax=Urechidicola croceus TaxID=1850246 RepID=A0A1D8P5Y6_9FLAO|nr:heme-binding domain-containing protein [Urechidicola croceus]AOW19998.1 cytochrome C [Urechidicola croceus]